VFVKVTPQIHLTGPAHDLLARPGLQDAIRRSLTPGDWPGTVTC
jgi:hypothetical protein